MVYWALAAFVAALIAGLFGFGGAAAFIAACSQAAFFVFVFIGAGLIAATVARDSKVRDDTD